MLLEATGAARKQKDELKVALQNAKSPRELEEALLRTYRFADEMFSEQLTKSGDKIACRAGCFFCCYIKVDATPLEVFLVVEFLKKRFSPSDIQDIHSKAKANAEKVSKLTAEQHINSAIPCPLLRDGKCSVYQVRPFVCRKHHSIDAGVCEKILTQPEQEVQRGEVTEITYSLATLISAVHEAFHQEGLDATPYDFSSALSEAMSSPTPYRRWRDKKSPFNKGIVAKDWKDAD